MVVVVVALAFGGASPAGAKGSPAEAEIRRAYVRVLDRSLPLDERLELIEDGEQLRDTIRALESQKAISGFRVKTAGFEVHSTRVHDGDAEVVLSLLVNGQAMTGWTGVARKIDGQWKVASATVCTILFVWTTVRCPQGPKGRLRYNEHRVDATMVGREHRLPLTFADGGRASLVVPSELTESWNVRPRAELLLNGDTPISVWFEPGRVPATEAVRAYPGAPGRPNVVLDSSRGLVVDLDEWTAHASGLAVYNDDGALTERERALVARHLSGYTTDDGYPVLTPTGPLAFSHPQDAPTGAQLAKSALSLDASRNPIELSWSDGESIYVAVVLTQGPCWTQPPQQSADYWAVERCTDNAFGRIAVEGNPIMVAWLLDALRVVDYHPPAATVSV